VANAGTSGYIAKFSSATNVINSSVLFETSGRIGVGKLDPSVLFDINGDSYVSGSLNVSGSIYGLSKSFLIDHPSKPGMKLQHGVTEGPEHSVFVRGKLMYSNTIILPEYWCSLIDHNTITIQLTPINRFQKLYVSYVDCTFIGISNEDNGPIECYYFVQAERKDIPKLTVEF
jgi:hypothetical protein